MALLEGNNSTGDDVVAVNQGASDRLADAVDINRRCCDKGDGEADGGRQKAGNHQHTEPTHINAVVRVCDPGAERFPVALASAANSGGHNRKEDG